MVFDLPGVWMTKGLPFAFLYDSSITSDPLKRYAYLKYRSFNFVRNLRHGETLTIQYMAEAHICRQETYLETINNAEFPESQEDRDRSDTDTRKMQVL